MQVFHPSHVELEPCGDRPAAPATRASTAIASPDGGLTSGVWESDAGRQTFRHATDEWVHILDGEVWVSAAGETVRLQAGDVAFFPAGLEMEWDVPDHVRKVWVQRRPALTRRIVGKATRLTTTRRPVQVAGVAGGAAAVGWALAQAIG